MCEVYKDACIGKILIQTNDSTGEPELHYLRLPSDIKNGRVLLMDATLATGAAAIMGIRVLLDHAVEEENIFLVSILMSEQGNLIGIDLRSCIRKMSELFIHILL